MTNDPSSLKTVEKLLAVGSMRVPNLNALRAFDTAGRHLNFQRAADEMHLTQGAVAQAVRRLEADLGVALFERRPRGLEFTLRGRRYHGSIRRAFALMERATASLADAATRVTLSVPPSVATKWLVPRLPDFSERHPDIEVQVNASEALATFAADGIDIAIRIGAPPFGPRLRAERLAPTSLRAVASPAFARRLRRGRSLRRFANLALIQDGHGAWHRVLGDAGIAHRGRMLQFNQTALAVDAAINGQGVALAPALLVADDVTAGRLIELWCEPRRVDDATGFFVVHPAKAIGKPAEAMRAWLLLRAGMTQAGSKPELP